MNGLTQFTSSILFKLVFRHLVAIATIAVATPILLYWFLDSNVQTLQRTAFTAQADEIAQSLSQTEEGELQLNLSPSLKAQFSSAYGRYRFSISAQNGRVLFSSSGDRTPIFPEASPLPQISIQHRVIGEHIIEGISAPERVNDKYVWIQIGEDLAHRDVVVDDVVTEFFRAVGWITIPLLLLLLIIDVFIFKRAIAPIVTASHLAEQITADRLNLRLPTANIPNEIGPLVRSINDALDRLEKSFNEQRSFAGDVAHELRTPLTILRTKLDVLPDRLQAATLKRDVDHMVRVINQLLDSAEADITTSARREVSDLHGAALEVVSTLAPLAFHHGKSISLTGFDGPIIVFGNYELIIRVIRNLVENALAHSFEGMEVEVETLEVGTLRVLDRGIGIRETEFPLLFRRFWRGGQPQAGGAGLGLSIVKRILDGCGATISAKNRIGGGAEFFVRFVLSLAG